MTPFRGPNSDRTLYETAAKECQRIRKAKGLTQEAVALATGMARNNISRIESGKHRPTLETLARYAHACGVPLTELLATLDNLKPTKAGWVTR